MEQKEQQQQVSLDYWLNSIHGVFGLQPIYLLLKVEMQTKNGKLTRCIGVEGISPTADSLAFMHGLKDKNPLVG